MSRPFRPATGTYVSSGVLAELARLWDQAIHHADPHGPQVTQDQLAKRAGVPKATVNSWATGKSLPRDADQLTKVGDVLAGWARERPAAPGAWSQLLTADQDARAVPPVAPGDTAGSPLGRMISDLDESDALALEVHKAFEVSRAPSGTRAGRVSVPLLPKYLPRPEFDHQLRAEVAAAQHRSRLVIVVGDSSTGKTRACWEAIRTALPEGWRLWHPLTPERPDAVVEALRSGRVGARTVIWLNEAQSYLQPPQVGEQVATALQALLSDATRGPILVLGSLWPELWRSLTTMPRDSSAPNTHRSDPDTHSAARALLDQATEITIPRSFTAEQLTRLAATIASDPRLREAAQAQGGRLTQELAGAPELLRRYEHADPASRAVLWAAMDARRLGHSINLPEPLLEHAAPGYLDSPTWNQVAVAPDWFTTALDNLTALRRQLPGPLVRQQPRPDDPSPPHPLYKLAEYLEQHGSRERVVLNPPDAFWRAAITHVADPADQGRLGQSAAERLRYRYAIPLLRRANSNEPFNPSTLASLLANRGEITEAIALLRTCIDPRDLFATLQLVDLLATAGDLDSLRALAARGHPQAPLELAELLIKQGEHDEALDILRARTAIGNPTAASRLVELLVERGEAEEALDILRTRANTPLALGWADRLDRLLAERGEIEELRARADEGDEQADVCLIGMLAERGEIDELRARADEGDEYATQRLVDLLIERNELGEVVTRADTGSWYATARLARLLVEQGDVDELRSRADAGDEHAANGLVDVLVAQGEIDQALTLLRTRADTGSWRATAQNATERLARLLVEQGKVDEALALLRPRTHNQRSYEDEQLARLVADLLAERGKITTVCSLAGNGYLPASTVIDLLERHGHDTEAAWLKMYGLTAEGAIDNGS